MHISSSLRPVAVALTMTLASGAMTAAFAASYNAAPQQAQVQLPQQAQAPSQWQQPRYASPYDGPDFVVPANNINA